MRTKSILALIIALPLAVASCNKKEDSADGGGPTDGAGAYPLTTCVVSGEELGSMGEPVEYDHEGTTVKFCCKRCIPKFEKDPETYLAKLKG